MNSLLAASTVSDGDLATVLFIVGIGLILLCGYLAYIERLPAAGVAGFFGVVAIVLAI